MSEFIEKLRSSEPVWDAVNKVDKDQADVGLLIKIIRNEFKDWQPPKKPVVVPQRFADWIESQTDRKNESYWYIFDKFVKDSRRKKLGIDFFGVGDLSRYPQGWDKVLLSALVDGYTVEKEQLYKVVFLKTGDDEILLLKSDTFFIDWISIYNDLKYQFTEKEIKDIDERYIEFAVPVEEVES